MVGGCVKGCVRDTGVPEAHGLLPEGGRHCDRAVTTVE